MTDSGNLLHMAVDSIHDGEPISTVVDRVINLCGSKPSEAAVAAVNRILEQVNSGSVGASTASTGGSVSRGVDTNGGAGVSYGDSKLTDIKAGKNSYNKLLGKGVIHQLHTTPDTCSLNYPPSYTKTESILHEVSLKRRIEVTLRVKGNGLNYLKGIGIESTDVNGATKFLKRLDIKPSNIVVEKEPGLYLIDWEAPNRQEAKKQVDDVAFHIGKALGKTEAFSVHAVEWARSLTGGRIIWQTRISI